MTRSRRGVPAPAPWLNDVAVPDLKVEVAEYKKGCEPPAFGQVPFDPWSMETVAQEVGALLDPGPLAGMRQALDRTLLRLARGRNVYERRDQREGAKIQIEAVLAFFSLFGRVRAFHGDMPLRALLRGLEGLDRGAVEPMLEPKKKPTGRPVTLQSLQVRAYAAAGVDLALRSGYTLSAACNFVADQLDAAGYRAAAGRGDGRITGNTVRAWRREAREREAADPMRWVYDKLLAGSHSFTTEWGPDFFFDELRCCAPLENAKKPPRFSTRKKTENPTF